MKKLNQTSFIGHTLNVTRTKQIQSPKHKISPEKVETPPPANGNRNNNIKKTNWEIITEIANNKSE